MGAWRKLHRLLHNHGRRCTNLAQWGKRSRDSRKRVSTVAPLEATGPNAEQIKFWNEGGGANFVKQQRMIDATIRPMGLQALDHTGLKEGAQALDVGCGCGDSSLEIARRVGSSGKVIGLDISTPMLDRAKESARAEGVSNIEFINGDAQTYRLPAAAFDVIFSRFGVMFFAEPRAAFANLLSGLKKSGRMAFVCWQSPMKNPWMSVPGMVVAQYVQVNPPSPEAPGPFAFGDGSRVRSILEGAGFADVAVEDRSASMRLPGADIE